MPAAERQVFLRLAGGGFKSALARRVLQRALAAHAGLAPALMAQRLTVWGGPRAPVTAEGCRRLLAPAGEVESDGDGHGGPRRFEPFETLPADAPLPQPAQDAQPAWAYGGLRAQIVRRGEDCRIWSAEHELLTGRLPEIAAAAQALPAGTVLDGEVLLWPEDATRPAPPALLHRRLASKTPVRPAVFIVRDVLDRDDLTAAQRRAWLAPWLTRPLRLLPWLDGDAGSAPREHARAHGAQGVLLLPRTGVAPIRFWPAPPLTLRGVPIYAEADAYTLAVWSRPPRDADEARAVAAAIAERRPPAPGAPRLLPLTRAASALPADDAAQLAQVARETTVQRFGPVRSLLPTVVVELGFADLHRSARHKSGFVLQAPRLLRLRGDLRWDQADSVARLQALSPDAGDEGEIVNRL
jgi:DNA ligase-1